MSSSLLKIPLKLLLLLFVLAGILLVSLLCFCASFVWSPKLPIFNFNKISPLDFHDTKKNTNSYLFEEKKQKKNKTKTKRKHFQIKNTFSSSKNISPLFLFDLNFFIEIFFFNSRELFGEFFFSKTNFPFIQYFCYYF